MKKQFIFYFIPFIFIVSSCQSTGTFKLVLLPDTQNYSAAYPEIFKAQTEWIADNAREIAFVLHQGDITDNNIDEQWQNARAALTVLDGKVPYTVVTGNHDIGDPNKNSNIRKSELFNNYFPYEKYSQMKHFQGAFETGYMDNVYHTFRAGGTDWLILSLEFGPRNKVLDWAKEVIEKHPRHKIIINTHAYMYSDNTRMSIHKNHFWVPQSYGLGSDTGEDAVNDAEMMWEKLVSKYPNILLVFSGHVLHSGTGKLISQGVHGNKVYQMLANYQTGVEGSEKGGNGFLRMLTIDTKKKEIRVQSYSPYIDSYKTEDSQEFVFKDVEF
ncbi:MAG: metallophosphoesterase [Tannerellaceae bacterium]|jgi:3',5'-cyclic AMP phosphodiesterase CpdA|nr:metallophosphoesterase [Tannerellaceae bacterium]